MFDFLRPIQDPTLRIMIPEEILDRHQHHSHHGSASNSRNGNSGQCVRETKFKIKKIFLLGYTPIYHSISLDKQGY